MVLTLYCVGFDPIFVLESKVIRVKYVVVVCQHTRNNARILDPGAVKLFPNFAEHGIFATDRY